MYRGRLCSHGIIPTVLELRAKPEVQCIIPRQHGLPGHNNREAPSLVCLSATKCNGQCSSLTKHPHWKEVTRNLQLGLGNFLLRRYFKQWRKSLLKLLCTEISTFIMKSKFSTYVNTHTSVINMRTSVYQQNAQNIKKPMFVSTHLCSQTSEEHGSQFFIKCFFCHTVYIKNWLICGVG
jgi:hypothetical protein